EARRDGPAVGDRQILVAIAIEVADGDGPRTVAQSEGSRTGRRLESPVAGADQHGDAAVAVTGVAEVKVGDRQIQLPIAIEVADGQGNGNAANSDRYRLGDERSPKAVAQYHRDGAIAGVGWHAGAVGDCQILNAIAMSCEVAHGHVCR